MKKEKKPLLLGAHISIVGGFEKAIERAEEIKTTCLQIFTKSNRQWNAKKIPASEAEKFKKTLENSDIRIVVAHATYLINLASNNEIVVQKSIMGLIEELNRCDLLGIPYLVLHPGSYVNSDQKTGLSAISRNLNRVLDQYSGTCMVLLENMAGQGSSLGHTFEQLATIRHKVQNKKKIGVCFDTCHAFAAGYDFTTQSGYNAMWDQFEKLIGLEHLRVIHLNDSKKGLNSRVDRHESIGKGLLGLNTFRLLINDPGFFAIPKIIETPKATLLDDQKNIEKLKGLIDQETFKYLLIKK